jgi:trk system potassium uptake protein TrkH
MNPVLSKPMNFFTKKPYYTILLSFVVAIIVGAGLLTLPIAHRHGGWGSFVDSLFMATSALAVTGLSVYSNVGAEFTTFGQVVLMILMVFGGLGIITIFTFFTIIIGKKIGIMERYMLKQALNLTTMEGALKFVKNIILIATLFITGGAFFYSLVLIPQFGLGEGIFQSFFLAISAFNNAGLDILGDSSLISYQNNILIQTVTIILIISGGLGFLVWVELFKHRFRFSKLSTFAKVVLIMSAILIMIGTAGLMITEFSQGSFFRFDLALFTSISSRTAGLTILSIRDLTNASKFLIMVLMFIGANPISTGGGVKTTTTFIVFLSIWALISGKRVHAFKRTFSIESILKAMALVVISYVFVLLIVIVIEYIEQFNTGYPDGLKTGTSLLFEVVSAFGTVGFSEGVTPYLADSSKVILLVVMLLGRIGPIAAISVFSDKLSWTEQGDVQYMEANVPIG